MGMVVAVLLAAAAWLGHAFLMTVGLNVWYSLPLRRSVHKRMRAVIALLVFAFPVVVAWVYGRQLLVARDDLVALAENPWVFGYLALCWLTALAYLPAVTLVRARRKTPPHVAD